MGRRDAAHESERIGMARSRDNLPPVDRGSRPQPGGPSDGGQFVGGAVNWQAFLRRVERKRRLLRGAGGAARVVPFEYYARATFVSFRLDGHAVTEDDARAALGVEAAGGEVV